MRTCPCCLEPLVPAASGRRGRTLAGACEVCATAVCQDCLRRQGPRPGRQVCLSCLWDIMSRRGYRPSFPQPPGRRRQAQEARRPACGHARAGGWMGFCPDCGDELPWTCAPGNPSCAVCAAPSHEGFNFCWACGESFEEDNPLRTEAEGYRLSFPCTAQCGGGVDWLMPFCPWCGELQAWHFADEAGEEHACPGCEASVEPAWAHCVFCGAATGTAPATAPWEEAEEGPQEAPQPAAPPDEDEEEAPSDAPREAPRAEAPWPGEDAQEEEAPAAGEEDAEEEDAEEEPPAPPVRREDSPWQVLGVAPGTPLSEVRRAWLSLVTQYHPDKVAQLGPKLQALAQEETRRLNAAWERIRQGAR